MKNVKVVICIFLLIPSILSAQKIMVEDIISVSNDIVRKTVGDSLFQYFDISEGSYYTDVKNHTSKFLKKKAIKGAINEIWVLYSFKYSHIDGIRGGMWVKLNSKLELTEALDYKFIPDFLLEGKSSNFISPTLILDKAKKILNKKGIKVLEPELKFNNHFNVYVYTITNILTQYKNEMGKDTGETEYCIIDAVTGNILSHDFGYYGTIIR
ncbi:hypothetical protein [Dysgonomonas sp. 25]|uniref:hypothetical protein n=1 Tax=Dysgonomonas sp. 25 TaxID=2302933 RepID=UPI0013D23A92|nr:hypothetical protein [Dysgonomonas sp. 25]NDV69598.1 hypothetical protein [Dysgonomonas sp. 25]